jgi:hypothetical protein
MEKFPEINEGQAVLLRAETNTGHVLDEQFKVILNDNQKAYTVFDSVEEALQFGNAMLAEKKNQVECVIYNRNQEALHYLNPFGFK